MVFKETRSESLSRGRPSSLCTLGDYTHQKKANKPEYLASVTLARFSRCSLRALNQVTTQVFCSTVASHVCPRMYGYSGSLLSSYMSWRSGEQSYIYHVIQRVAHTCSCGASLTCWPGFTHAACAKKDFAPLGSLESIDEIVPQRENQSQKGGGGTARRRRLCCVYATHQSL